MLKVISIFLLFSFLLFAQYENLPSPQEIEKELQSAKDEFDEAKKLFNPWFAGPLLTGSGNTFPPGKIGVQTYLYVENSYALFTSSGSTKYIPNFLSITPLVVLFTGLTNNVEISADFSWSYNRQSGLSDHGFNDIGLRVGIGLFEETLTMPAVKLNIKEFFPTGKFENLDPLQNTLDATGSGAYTTAIGIAASKVILFDELHPMSLRGSLNLSIPTKVSVEEFNIYGGGFGTNGVVSPSITVTAAFAFEYSINQNWVFSNDFLYTYSTIQKFDGILGFNADGTVATVGGPFSDNLSVAPAIEYNPSQDLSFVAGVWVSVWGRNSLKFITPIVTVYFSF